MGQLEGLIKHSEPLGLFSGDWCLSLLGLFAPMFDQPFVLISPISEVAESVDVEGVLAHADHILFQIGGVLVDLPVHFLRILLHFFAQ